MLRSTWLKKDYRKGSCITFGTVLPMGVYIIVVCGRWNGLFRHRAMTQTRKLLEKNSPTDRVLL